ncbi:MAG TPA: hypothetical protein VI456_06190, partial [Polyangia bacterium]
MSTGNRSASFAMAALCATALACGSTPNSVQTGQGGGGAAGGTLDAGGTLGGGGSVALGGQAGENSPTTRKTITLGAPPDANVDILFVLDDWASTTVVQQKLYDQIPLFLSVLKASPMPLDLHVAVVTPDMGVSGDTSSAIICTPHGDDGAFRSAPTGMCSDTTVAAGATFLTDDGRGTTNFTGSISDVLQCIFLVGNGGCGFGQPLAAAEHALGADNVVGGVPTPPAVNAGFLRPDAALAIIFLADQDDCSAPAGTPLFSLGGDQNLTNPLGPLQHYRCNQFGHLCQDPGMGEAYVMPPLTPPADAQGTAAAPTLDLQNCKDNDQGTGLLTPVSRLVADLQALKSDPDNQILVASIVAPASPYSVAWVPAGSESTLPGELWPKVEQSCGAAGGEDLNPEATMNPTDGSFGDPGVRIAAFANSFSQSVVASICDPTYASTAQAIATKIAALPNHQDCLTGPIQRDGYGQPSCTVTASIANASGDTLAVPYPNCDESGNVIPCWTLASSSATCNG